MQAARTIQIDSCTRWDRTTPVTITGEQPDTSAEDARTVLLGLDEGITRYRGLACDDGCWGCEVEIDGDWHSASMEDHSHESAEIHWA